MKRLPFEQLKIGSLYEAHFGLSANHNLWETITQYKEDNFGEYNAIENGSVFLLLSLPVEEKEISHGYWINALVGDKRGWFYLATDYGMIEDEYVTEVNSRRK